jgi:cytoskeleton protein RodZ
VSDDNAEPKIVKSEQEKSLGESLVAARELRGLSRTAVEKETRIPHDYIRMLESDDYAMISDQLYLLPFLRRYAGFLGLDREETGMRFVREVQRAENNPPPRIAVPLDDVRHRKRRNWGKPLMFAALTAVVVGAYIAQTHRRDAADSSNSVPAPVPPQVPSATQLQAPALNSLPANASANPPLTAPAVPPVASSAGSVAQQSTEAAHTSPSQPIVVPAVVVPAEPLPAAANSQTMHRATNR